MTEGPLAGIGVLVTRPRHQAAPLSKAIEELGGTAVAFPVLEIVPRSAAALQRDAARLSTADIAIFVSANAVQHGLGQAGAARLAAVGPATAAAIEAAGSRVDIVPRRGFDSEHLLAEPSLTDVAGKVVRIIRGQAGRELLGDTLRQRGATVEYLAVYERRAARHPPAELDRLDEAWRDGRIGVVTLMSVASLDNLLASLPRGCLQRLATTPLVTPAARVIKEAGRRIPGIPTSLAPGPGPDEMAGAIVALGLPAAGNPR